MTELKSQRGGSLVSSTIITDAGWHRIGLVWDGTSRMLFIDGVQVATDAMTSLSASTTGLHIGAAGALTPGSFWSGLIDEVRIYNQAVKP